MLVLSRKPGQSIIINDDIKITLVSIRGTQVRIGIEAPNSVAIFREELLDTHPAVKDDQELVGAGTSGSQLTSTSLVELDQREAPRSVRR